MSVEGSGLPQAASPPVAANPNPIGDALEARIASLTQIVEKQSELLAKVALEGVKPPAAAPKPADTQPVDVAGLVAAEVTKREQQVQAQKNLATVAEKLKVQFQDSEQGFTKLAETTGVATGELKALAQTSPQLVLQLLAAQAPATRELTGSLNAAVATQAVVSTAQAAPEKVNPRSGLFSPNSAERVAYFNEQMRKLSQSNS